MGIVGSCNMPDIIKPPGQKAPTAQHARVQASLQMSGELPDCREVENLRQIDLIRIFVVNLLVDFNELERACAELEEVVIDTDALAFECGVTD